MVHGSGVRGQECEVWGPSLSRRSCTAMRVRGVLVEAEAVDARPLAPHRRVEPPHEVLRLV